MSGSLVQARLARVPLPQRMRTLRKDVRGYPVPFLVLIDKSGVPQFTINDHTKAFACQRKHLCAICGKKFERNPSTFEYEMWFVGGSRCFLHSNGAFLDPPMHRECGEYALRVCPFLAARRYIARIDDAKLSTVDLPEDRALVRTEHMMPDLPERFGFGMTYEYQFLTDNIPGVGVFVVPDWRYVEWWQAGVRINAPDTGEPPADPRRHVDG